MPAVPYTEKRERTTWIATPSELVDAPPLFRLQRPDGIVQAMLNVVLHQYALGLLNGLFHSVKLLRQVQAGFSLVHHANHALEMAPGPLQAFDNVRVRLMLVIIYHV